MGVIDLEKKKTVAAHANWNFRGPFEKFFKALCAGWWVTLFIRKRIQVSKGRSARVFFICDFSGRETRPLDGASTKHGSAVWRKWCFGRMRAAREIWHSYTGLDFHCALVVAPATVLQQRRTNRFIEIHRDHHVTRAGGEKNPNHNNSNIIKRATRHRFNHFLTAHCSKPRSNNNAAR